MAATIIGPEGDTMITLDNNNNNNNNNNDDDDDDDDDDDQNDNMNTIMNKHNVNTVESDSAGRQNHS
jgi:hypothetical protein